MDSVTGEKSDNQVSYSDKPAINSAWETKYLANDLPFCELESSYHFHGLAQQENESFVDYYKMLDIYNHPVLPLFCSNNKDDFVDRCCYACGVDKKFGKDDYICRKCGQRYHKACVESLLEIKHPHHPKHSLKLVLKGYRVNCFYCGEIASKMVYNCALCKLSMHPACAMKPVSFVLNQTNRHDHPLTFFTRRAPLDCNVCGLTSEVHPTYICHKCNFVAHRDCAYSPGVIRISRHNHRISFVLSFPPRKWSCGVCGKDIDSEYGGYTCNKCDDYAVHSRCALRKRDVWDENDLEGVPEEDDIKENVEPFKIQSEGTILHFSHEHPLRVETNKRKICQACIIPIYEGDFYSCIECNFILHDTCTNAPRQKQHALHSHPLTLNVGDENNYFIRDACEYKSCGFIYRCDNDLTWFELDVRCASISVPSHYQGHEHLFLSLSPGEFRKCQVCKKGRSSGKALNCNECDFIICFSCVTVPYMVRYKNDIHFLTLCFGDDETSKPDWCEICEENSPSGQDKRFACKPDCCEMCVTIVALVFTLIVCLGNTGI